MHAGDDQCKHGADAEDTVQVVCLWSLYSFLLFQPLHNHEQHQRAAKGRQRRDLKPAQGWRPSARSLMRRTTTTAVNIHKGFNNQQQSSEDSAGKNIYPPKCKSGQTVADIL